jgi:hypothetical protein
MCAKKKSANFSSGVTKYNHVLFSMVGSDKKKINQLRRQINQFSSGF